MSNRWNLVLPGLSLWRLGCRGSGFALAAAYAAGVVGIFLLALEGHSNVSLAWLLIPVMVMTGAIIASECTMRKIQAQRRQPAWRLHVAYLRETVEAHLERGRNLEALMVIEEWLRETPNSAEAWVFKARLDAANGRLSRARQDYQRAARWDHDGRFGDEIRHALEVLDGMTR